MLPPYAPSSARSRAVRKWRTYVWGLRGVRLADARETRGIARAAGCPRRAADVAARWQASAQPVAMMTGVTDTDAAHARSAPHASIAFRLSRPPRRLLLR